MVTDAEIDFSVTRCLTVTIISDNNPEPTEMFSVALTSSDPAVILAEDLATVTILERAPIGIEFPSYVVEEAAVFLEVCVVSRGFLTESVRVFLLSSDVSTTSGTGGELCSMCRLIHRTQYALHSHFIM